MLWVEYVYGRYSLHSLFQGVFKDFMVFVSLEIILQLRVDLLWCIIAVWEQRQPLFD